MKKLLTTAGLMMAGSAAFAGQKYGPSRIDPNTDGDVTGAVILLGLVAVVIASNTIFGGSSTAMKPTLAEDDQLENDS